MTTLKSILKRLNNKGTGIVQTICSILIILSLLNDPQIVPKDIFQELVTNL